MILVATSVHESEQNSSPRNPVLLNLNITLIFKVLSFTLSSWIRVQNVQVCHIGTHIPWWFAASIPLSSTLDISPNAIPPQSPHPLLSLP